MYRAFYGLSELPFQLTPDPRYYFESESHRRALSYLLYGLEKAEGFVVVTGEVGSGKTVMLDELLSRLEATRYAVSRIESTQLEADDLLRMIALGFDIAAQGLDKATTLAHLRHALGEMQRTGIRTLIVIDEAQNLLLAGLEELRMLSNFRVDGRPLLQAVLLGQPQFRERLAAPDLEQLRQRVIASCALRGLEEAETRPYVEHRLSTAGWIGDPAFANDVFPMIYRATGGLPRRINMLLERLLLLGFLDERHEIGQAMVQQVVREMRDEGLLLTMHVTVGERNRG